MSFPDLERIIYNNEIFSLLGFVFLILSYLKRMLPTYGLSLLYAFIMYGIILIALSSFDILDTGLYLSLRTMVVWYSLFGFFLGFFVCNSFNTHFIKKTANNLNGISWVLLFVPHFRLTPQVIFSIGKDSSIKSLITILLMLTVFYIVKPGATTITAMLMAVSLYLWSNSQAIKFFLGKKLIILFSIVCMVLLCLLIPVLNDFLISGYDDVGGDNNSTWRLMLWLYLLKEQFLNNPFFGLGFGTKLFDLDIIPSFITTDDGSRFTEYTLGTHNSFFYTAIRMGGIGFVLLILAIIKIYSVAVQAYEYASNAETKNIIFSLILANLMFVNSALFNVVLESPLYAANFWFTLGLMYAFSMKTLTTDERHNESIATCSNTTTNTRCLNNQ